jgi:hypothetical protein
MAFGMLAFFTCFVAGRTLAHRTAGSAAGGPCTDAGATRTSPRGLVSAVSKTLVMLMASKSCLCAITCATRLALFTCC